MSKKKTGQIVGLKAFVIAAVLASSAYVAHALKPTVMLAETREKVDFEKLVPERFGDWKLDPSVPVVVADPSALTLINQIYSQTVSRTYVNSSGQRVMLAIAYGANQSDALRLHVPEVCYVAQGFAVVSKSADTLSIDNQARPITKVVAKRDNRLEPIIYWVLVGDTIANSGLQQKLIQLRYGLKGQVPDGLLFRVSAVQSGGTPAFDVQSKFTADLFQHLPQDKRQRLEGVFRTS